MAEEDKELQKQTGKKGVNVDVQEIKMPDKYDKEIVVLETEEGTAHNEENLKAVWEQRIKEHFPHYKLRAIGFEKEGGGEC